MADYVGYRTQKRQSQQKKKKKAWKIVVALLVLVAIVVILGAAFKVFPFNKAWSKTAEAFVWLGRKVKGVFVSGKTAKPEQFLEAGKKTANYMVAVTNQLAGQTKLSTIALVSYDSRDNTASIIYFPSDLQVKVPGAGEDVLANLVELDAGKVQMTLQAVANLLGVQVDRYVLLSDADVRILMTKLTSDKYAVDVPKAVSFKDDSLNTQVDLGSGKQKATPEILSAYLSFAPQGGELDLINAQNAFVPILLEMSRGGLYGKIPQFVKQNAGMLDSSASDQQLTGFWQTISSLKGKSLQQAVLPLKEVTVEKTTMHILDRDKLDAFKRKYVKSDFPLGNRLRVEVLNGCSTPGIGEKVAAQLDPATYQVVNTGNADNFDYAETLVIVYTKDKNIQQAAEQVRKGLEVGRVETRTQNQNVVDISVIVGKDYAAK